MKVFVKVKPNTKEARIKRIDKDHFEVWVNAPPKKGMANKAVLEQMAEFFDVSKLRLKIISGKSSKQKIIDFC